jgi:hypothetical protein
MMPTPRGDCAIQLCEFGGMLGFAGAATAAPGARVAVTNGLITGINRTPVIRQR